MSSQAVCNAFETMMAIPARKKTTTRKHKITKKTNPQKNLKTYFAPKTNSVGYPMKHCRYQPEEDDFMYQPAWYGQRYVQDPSTEGVPPVYCTHCKLRPCLAREHQTDMTSLGHHLDAFQNKQPHEIRSALAYQLEMKRRVIFKLDCAAPMSQTQCVTNFVHFWYADAEESADEFSDTYDY